jgi:transposase
MHTYFGVDVSKHWLDFAIIDKRISDQPVCIRVDNKRSDLLELKERLAKQKIGFGKRSLVVIEHTGVYKNNLLNFLIAQKCHVCVETALRIKKSLGIQRGKNDLIDSKRIVRYAIKHQDSLTLWEHPRKSLMQLKELLTLRTRIIGMHSRTTIPLAELVPFQTKAAHSNLVKINRPLFDGIAKSMSLVTLEINHIIKTDRLIKKQVKLVTSVPGIGIVNALHLICYTHEFTLCKNKQQLASYIGVAPFEYSSGISVKGKKHVHPLANKKLKSLFHIAAISTIRKNGYFKKYFDKKVKEGKPKMLIINNIRNKIVHRVFAVVKRGTPFVKNLLTVKTKNSM